METATAELLLKAMVDWESDPALDQEIIDVLMTFAAVEDDFGNRPTNNASTAGTWANGTVLVGTVINEGGRFWRCVQPGTTAGSEPVWPTLTGMTPGVSSVADGTVIWLDQGSTWAGSYRLDGAAAMGWRLKAAKAASRFGFMTDGQQFSRQQLIAHCLMLATAYERRTSQSITIEVAS